MDEIPNTSLESPPEDEDDKEVIPLKMDSWTFTFFMNRYLRVTFLSIFQEAKKQLPKDRFLSKSFWEFILFLKVSYFALPKDGDTYVLRKPTLTHKYVSLKCF